MTSVPDIFGTMVFDDAAMKEYLPEETYTCLQKTIHEGKSLDPAVANTVANAMKDWAISKGATHFTHWFQPMTGITAEKHDSFISPDGNGKVKMVFSGKELVKGESDASSLPSGGLRATFEARGYTAWDPTSFAFIKDKTLCIPTAFCSYGGEALDKKTPLLRSMQTLDRQAVRVVHLFGNEKVHHVYPTVGPEQEYFLIDKAVYEKRPDLIYTGRTLFGARPPKGQELDDHYYGTIKPRVVAFMREVDEELWKLGIMDKTRHNESAPAQHELAPIYRTANIAADHNQLTMEIIKKVAQKHDLVCLLHEKPFEGVNGSGKHNNWGLMTDSGVNLLEPGETPYQNAQFLLFLCAIIKAVDEYPDLLRISVATAGNDHRLGINEAPPAIMSIFLGDELEEIFRCIEQDIPYNAKEKGILRIGVHTLPKIPKDTTDRNRTSPLAFTGNKFEFRSLGSSDSISDVNTVLNTIVAEELMQFADELEKAGDLSEALHELIRKVIHCHKRVIFSGNGYDDSWVEEAKTRGLMNLPTTPDALAHMLDEKNVTLFEKHGVLTRTELNSRFGISNENYAKIIRIEALTMLRMVRQDIIPALIRYKHSIAQSAYVQKQVSEEADIATETKLLSVLSMGMKNMTAYADKLEQGVLEAGKRENAAEKAQAYKTTVLPVMKDLRTVVDDMERKCDRGVWPYPSYGDLLFSVR